MAKYDVYGLGNAILDMEFRNVHDEVLISLGIDKGLMTLIDKDQHHELLGHLGSIPHVVACGGSVANSIATAAMLGANTFFSCRVADDTAGLHYHNNLLESGIDTNLRQAKPAGVTGKMIGLITPDAERSMNTFLGISQDTCIDDLDPAAIKNSEILYIEGYLLASPKGAEAAMQAKKIAKDNGVLTSVSLSDPNMVSFCKQGFKDLIADDMDLIFANESEAMLFAETDDLGVAIDTLKSLSKQFVITCGSSGALVYDGEDTTEIDPTPVNAVDTLGAGDTFAGTFLYALTRGSSPVQAAKLANYVAAKVVARYGPRLDSDEISDLRADVEYSIEGS